MSDMQQAHAVLDHATAIHFLERQLAREVQALADAGSDFQPSSLTIIADLRLSIWVLRGGAGPVQGSMLGNPGFELDVDGFRTGEAPSASTSSVQSDGDLIRIHSRQLDQLLAHAEMQQHQLDGLQARIAVLANNIEGIQNIGTDMPTRIAVLEGASAAHGAVATHLASVVQEHEGRFVAFAEAQAAHRVELSVVDAGLQHLASEVGRPQHERVTTAMVRRRRGLNTAGTTDHPSVVKGESGRVEGMRPANADAPATTTLEARVKADDQIVRNGSSVSTGPGVAEAKTFIPAITVVRDGYEREIAPRFLVPPREHRELYVVAVHGTDPGDASMPEVRIVHVASADTKNAVVKLRTGLNNLLGADRHIRSLLNLQTGG